MATITDALNEVTDVSGTTGPALQRSLVEAAQALEAIEETFSTDPNWVGADVSIKAARSGAALASHFAREAIAYIQDIGNVLIVGSATEPQIAIGNGSLQTSGVTAGTIKDGSDVALDGTTRNASFSVVYEPASGTPDRVSWYIDGVLYRDDDELSPYQLRYNGEALPVRVDFQGESAPAGQGSPATFRLDTGTHTITAIDHRAAGDQSITATITVPEPVTGGGSPPAGAMLWAPPELSSLTDWSSRAAVKQAAIDAGFQIETLGAGGHTTISAGGADIFIDQTGIRTGTVRVNNARHVIWRGGHVNVSSDNGGDNVNMIGRFINCTGIAHVEGVYGTGDNLVEGFHGGSSSAGFELHVMNSFCDWIHGNQNINHSDPIQMYAGAAAIWVDLFTYKSHYQGLMMKADSGRTPSWILGRLNGYLAEGSTSNDNDPNGGGRFGFWNTGGLGSPPITSLYDDGNWLDENSQGGSFAKAIWNNNSSVIKTDVLGDYVEFQEANQSGKVRQGVPVGGDWVNPADIGLAYANADGFV